MKDGKERVRVRGGMRRGSHGMIALRNGIGGWAEFDDDDVEVDLSLTVNIDRPICHYPKRTCL